MIILTCIALAILLAGIVFYRRDFETMGGSLIAFASITLLFIVLAWPMNYASSKTSIVEYKEIRASVERARMNGVDLENAALQQEIIKANRWLRKTQYWNATLFDRAIPDEVDSLEVIE